MAVKTGIALNPQLKQQPLDRLLLGGVGYEIVGPVFEVRDRPLTLQLFNATMGQTVEVKTVLGDTLVEQDYRKDGTPVVLDGTHTSVKLETSGRYRLRLLGIEGPKVQSAIDYVGTAVEIPQPSGQQANKPNLLFGGEPGQVYSPVVEIIDTAWAFTVYGIDPSASIAVLAVFGYGPTYREEPVYIDGNALYLSIAYNSKTLARTGRYRFRMDGDSTGVLLVGNPTRSESESDDGTPIPPGGGTVTSVGITPGAGLTSTGGPIVTAGNINIGFTADTLASLAAADSALQPGEAVQWAWLTGVPANIQAWAAIAPAAKFDTPVGTTAQYVRGDGSLATFPAVGSGTVTSVGLAAPTGFTVSGSPVVSSGVLTFAYTAGYQGYTGAEATKLAGIASGATVGATWGTNLNSIPANITSWAAIAPATKFDTPAGSTAQYVRGDGTLASFTAAAIGADPAGAAAAAIAAHVAATNPHIQYLRTRIDTPIGLYQDPDIADGIISICANGLSNPTPAIEAWADNGTTQANISATSFGVNGGGIFHGRGARGTKASPTGVLKGDVYAGYGGRPYATGVGFLPSSPVSLHWVAAEDQTNTGYGGYFRVLTTKTGTTTRAEIAVGTDNGVWWAHDQQFAYDPTSYAQTSFLTGYTGMLVSSHNQAARHVIASYGGLPSVNLCGAGGTPSAPAALGSGANMAAIAFTTYAGSWVAPAIVIARTTEAHSGSAQGTELVFGSTSNGSALRVERWKLAASGDFITSADNTYDLGGASARPKQLWAATGTINTSDAREKTPLRELNKAEISAATELAGMIGTYRWLSAVAEKGLSARQHVGLTVQKAIEIMEGYGLDAFSYGFICHDIWDETPEIVGEDDISGERKVMQKYMPAGDRYSFRTDQLNLFIAAGLAASQKSLDLRISELEKAIGMR